MNALPDHEQLLDLLALHSTQALSDAEAAQLQSLLNAHPQLQGDEFDSAAAAILLASSVGERAMPSDLAAKVLAGAPTQHRNPVVALPRTRVWQSPAAGWWSAAACLLLAVSGWWPRLAGNDSQPAAVAMLTPEQQRAALLNSGHAIQASWSPGNLGTTAAASTALVGDVVFDPTTQRGFLRFRGIPANDPRLAQYQLWIADATRQPPEPIDGGIFNTPQNTAGGDVIIPFAATLPVGKPAAFVVTLEQPGGVVVSKQERVLALAKVQRS